MEICGAVSIYCRLDSEWTFTCQAATDHEPGLHDYQVDPGQPDIPTEG